MRVTRVGVWTGKGTTFQSNDDFLFVFPTPLQPYYRVQENDNVKATAEIVVI